MTNERQQLAQILTDVPGPVKLAMLLALVLGLLLGVNGILTSVAAGTFSAKWVFYAALIFLVYASNGVSLLKKGRLGYVFSIVLALLPLLGSFARSVHLLAMTVKGEAGANLETLISLIATLQLLAIVGLVICLLAGSTRRFIWRRDQTQPVQPEAPETEDSPVP